MVLMHAAKANMHYLCSQWAGQEHGNLEGQ